MCLLTKGGAYNSSACGGKCEPPPPPPPPPPLTDANRVRIRAIHFVELQRPPSGGVGNSPDMLGLSATVGRAHLGEVSWSHPTDYGYVEAGRRSCVVVISSWNNVPLAGPVIVRTHLQLEAGLTYSVVIVGQTNYAGSGSDFPFDQVFAVLIEDTNVGLRDGYGRIRLAHVSPGTAPLMAHLDGDNRAFELGPMHGHRRESAKPTFIGYICQPPSDPSGIPPDPFPPGPPPPQAFCDPTDPTSLCPQLNPSTGKPYTCQEVRPFCEADCRMCPCKSNPLSSCDPRGPSGSCPPVNPTPPIVPTNCSNCSFVQCQKCACPKGKIPHSMPPACGAGGVLKDWRGINESVAVGIGHKLPFVDVKAGYATVSLTDGVVPYPPAKYGYTPIATRMPVLDGVTQTVFLYGYTPLLPASPAPTGLELAPAAAIQYSIGGPTLQDISVSMGNTTQKLTPAFQPTILSYSITEAPSADANFVTITANVTDKTDTVAIKGVQLNPNQVLITEGTTKIPVTVTKGSATTTYELTFIQPKPLHPPPPTPPPTPGPGPKPAPAPTPSPATAPPGPPDGTLRLKAFQSAVYEFAQVRFASTVFDAPQTHLGMMQPEIHTVPPSPPGPAPPPPPPPPSPPPPPPPGPPAPPGPPGPPVDCLSTYSTQSTCDANKGCTWCSTVPGGGIPPASNCQTLAAARGLPPTLFKCDKKLQYAAQDLTQAAEFSDTVETTGILPATMQEAVRIEPQHRWNTVGDAGVWNTGQYNVSWWDGEGRRQRLHGTVPTFLHPGAVLFVESGSSSSPTLSLYQDHELAPPAGWAAVRVIHAAAAIGSITAVAVEHGTSELDGLPLVNGSIAYLGDSRYVHVPGGVYTFHARAVLTSTAGHSAGNSSSCQCELFLYEGMSYTVLLGNTSSGSLQAISILDRYDSNMTVETRLVNLGVSSSTGASLTSELTVRAYLGGISAEERSSAVGPGEASEYTTTVLPAGTSLRVGVQVDGVECFGEIVPVTTNATKWTYVAWGAMDGLSCSVKSFQDEFNPTDGHAGVRTIRGGITEPKLVPTAYSPPNKLTIERGLAPAGYVPVTPGVFKMTNSSGKLAPLGTLNSSTMYTVFIMTQYDVPKSNGSNPSPSPTPGPPGPPSPTPPSPTPGPAVNCLSKYSTQSTCDADKACSWCKSITLPVPPNCNTVAEARSLPPTLFKCDKLADLHQLVALHAPPPETATLKNLSVDLGNMTPPFQSSVLDYTVAEKPSADAKFVTITATPNLKTATIKINGFDLNPNQVLISEGKTVVPVQVAANGATTTYHLTFIQPKPLHPRPPPPPSPSPKPPHPPPPHPPPHHHHRIPPPAPPRIVSKTVLVADRGFGTATPFKLRFISTITETSLTLRHGGDDFGDTRLAVLESTGTTGSVSKVARTCFARVGIILEAWKTSKIAAPQVSLGTVRAHSSPQAKRDTDVVEVRSCPPHCALANQSIGKDVASWPWQTASAVLVHDLVDLAASIHIVPDDSRPAPHLSYARLRVVSFVPGKQVSVLARPRSKNPATFSRSKTDYGVASYSQELTAEAYSIVVSIEGSRDGGKVQTNATLHDGRTYTLYVFCRVDGHSSSIAGEIFTHLEEDSDFYGHARVRVAHASPSTAATAVQLLYAEGTNGTYQPHQFPSIEYGDYSDYMSIPVVNHSSYSVRLEDGESRHHSVLLGVGENWTLFVVPPRSAGSVAEIWAVKDAYNSNAMNARGLTLIGQLQVGLRWMNALPPAPNDTTVLYDDALSADWVGATCQISGEKCLTAGLLANYGDEFVEYKLSTLDSIAGIPERWGLQAQARKNGAKQSTANSVRVREDISLRGGELGTLVLTGASPDTPELKLFIEFGGNKPSFYATWKYAVLLGVASACALTCCGGLLAQRRWHHKQHATSLQPVWSIPRRADAGSQRRTMIQ